MKKFLLTILLLTSCANLNTDKVKMIEDINIYENLTFDEFKNKIILYVKESDYPDTN
tara:strand:+ start:555 stop:725 length:171 start_codon:yes stop_codon:yes gene_type:complete